MESGFIRGGTGAEVDMMSILPDSLRGFSSQAKQDAFSDAFERKNGVVVRRPWDSPESLADRRSKAPTAKPEPAFGMAPEIAEKQLKILLREYSPTHPDPARLAVVKTQIHELQDLLRLERTNFDEPTSARAEHEAQTRDLADKLKKYQDAKPKARRQIIEAIKNVPLLKLIRDTEPELDLQKDAITRISELELL